MEIKHFSEAEVLEDYRTGMQMVAESLAAFVGERVAAGLGGLTDAELANVGPGFSPSVQLLSSEGAKLLQQVHQFAVFGKLSDWLIEEIDDNSIRRWITMFAGLQMLVAANWGGAPFHKCLKTLRLADKRVSLMPGTHTYSLTGDGASMVQGAIYLSELALLSGLEEKTLRNMGSKNHKQYLPTIKRGSRTYVSINVAWPWLESRGFAPTIFDSAPARRNLEVNPFYSVADLVNFVAMRRAEIDLTEEALNEKVKDNPNLLSEFRALEQGALPKDGEATGNVARLLDIEDVSVFTEAINELANLWRSFSER